MEVTQELTVASTILAQLGGRRFIVCTGAKDFVGGRDFLQFRLPRGLAKDGITRVRIVLTPMDVYTVETWRVTGRTATLVDSREDVYCDVLQDVFSRMTGLVTRL